MDYAKRIMYIILKYMHKHFLEGWLKTKYGSRKILANLFRAQIVVISSYPLSLYSFNARFTTVF